MRLGNIAIASSLLIVIGSMLISGQALAALNQPAQVIGMPFMTTDNAIYGMPSSFGGFLMTEFNSTSLSQSDLEKLNIDFPLFSDIPGAEAMLGPTSVHADDAKAAANILPFGPVNLAFPSIGQTVDQTLNYQDTYFFSDSLG